VTGTDGRPDWPAVISRLVAGSDLDADEAAAALEDVMAGNVGEVLVSSFLTALAAKGATGDEVAGLVRAMVAAATPLDVAGPVLDTCGTGGDGAGTFNISTTSALVCAAAGARVAKHGNRAASSRAGSADLLEHWGVVIDLGPEGARRCLEEVGISFLFARTYHPAMRHVAPVRSALGIRTVFNVLGPLSNPAGAQHQVVGVSDERMAPVMADALARLGRRALVFRGDDGLDELTTTATSRVWHVEDGEVRESRLDPTTFGIRRVPVEALVGGDVERNAEISEAVLSGVEGPHADVVALNAAAGLWVHGIAEDLAEGLAIARDVMAAGGGTEVLHRWVALSQEVASA
jgi:anthranilate phosphoribosyltransferase